MTQKDLNKISMLPFEATSKRIEAVINGLQFINETADGNEARNLADEALEEVYESEQHLKAAKAIINNNRPDEPSFEYLFLKVHAAMQEVQERIANEMASTEDIGKLADLAQAKALLSDATEIIERADHRAQYFFKGSLQPRIVLKAMAEYFTIDDTTATQRYCRLSTNG